ncbi:MAG: glycosyltransferase family 39 protein [Anaerolineae bacterium]
MTGRGHRLGLSVARGDREGGTRLALALVTLCAYALRLYRVPQLSLRGDEALTVIEAGVPWSTLLHTLATPRPHQPLYYPLLHWWMRLAGDGELAVRYLTIAAGVVMLPLLYQTAREVLGRDGRATWLAVAAVAVINPMLVWDAQDNRMYPLLAVLDLAAFYCALRLLKGRGGRGAWLGYVTCATLALYTHYLAGFVLVAINLVAASLLLNPRRRARFVPWVAAQAAVAALFAPWLLTRGSIVGSFTSDFLPALSLAEMARRSLTGLSLGFSASPPANTILGAGFLAMVVLGLLPHRGNRPAPPDGQLSEGEARAVLLAYLIAPIACIIAFSRLRFPIFDERYIMLSMPPFLMLVGRGVSYATAAPPRRYLALAGCLWIVIASGYSLRNYFYVPRYMKGVDWRTYVGWMVDRARPGDAFVQNYPDPGLTYHLRDRLPRYLLPDRHPMDREGTVAALADLSARYERLWLQPQRFATWDSEGLVETWLDRHALKVGERWIGVIRLALYLPAPALERSMSPVQATLGDSVQLLGYDLLQPPAAQLEAEEPRLSQAMGQAGHSVRLALYWRAQAPVDADYSLFVHVYGPDMRLWAQHDGPPLGPDYPTGQWQAGETLVGRYTLDLPSEVPPGTYRLAAGLYSWQTGERLSACRAAACDGDGIVWLGELQVTGP